MKKMLLMTGLFGVLSLAATAQTPLFQPGQLAVLQMGDGRPIFGGVPSDIYYSRQNLLFIDQFNPTNANQSAPVHQVAIPTNGFGALWVNGNAGTEGNLTLAGDRSVLALAGYYGDICSQPAVFSIPPIAPSNLSYDRGISTVDAFGNYVSVYHGGDWYGVSAGKTNPRGVATDGAGHFWGCGNGTGELFYDANTGNPVIQFESIVLTSCSKVINGILYGSVKSGEANGLAPGIYSHVHFDLTPYALPVGAAFPHLEIPANASYQNCIGFDINPQGNIAYVADNKNGIQKYLKTGSDWNLAYNLSIPGYTNLATGIMLNPGSTNNLVGCFSVAVDWSGANPVVYATTGDAAGYDPRDPKKGSLLYYCNRVIRINDTNTTTSGANLIATTNILTTVVQAPVPPSWNQTQTNNYIVYKSVVFTPDLRPAITANPANWSAVTGDNIGFTVAASAKYALTYQWLQNGTNSMDGSATTSSLTLNSVDTSYNNFTYQCVVSDTYGSVTSAVATLKVNSTAVAPSLGGPVQTITNFYGNNFSITATVAGTDPKGGYQWFTNGVALTDGGEFSGTTSSTLNLVNAQLYDTAVYSLGVTNRGGSNYFTVANLTVNYAKPLFVQQPAAATTFSGRNAGFSASIQGYALTNTWFISKSSGASMVPVTLGTRFNQADNGSVQPAISRLQITPTQAADATNYVLVVSNPSGAITSAPVALTLYTQPAAHTFVSYTAANQPYTQNFDTLPIPGGGSFEGGNPLDVTYSMTNFNWMLTNVLFTTANAFADVTYGLDNPVDFGYPIIPAGGIGGLGLSNSLGGWYAWTEKPLLFAVTSGDQSAAGIIDNGPTYNNVNGYTNQTFNRALGLLTSSKSGTVAFGAALVNNSGKTLKSISLQFTGELWRDNPLQQALQFGYVIDPAGTGATFPTNDVLNGTLNYITDLTVAFPTNSLTVVDNGTLPANQVHVAVANLPLAADWPAGQTLWLVWQSSTSVGGAQNVAIDNVAFSAGTDPVLTIQSVGGNAVISWPTAWTGYTLQQNSNLTQPSGWVAATSGVSGSSGANSTYTVTLGGLPLYFRLVK